MTIHHPYGTIDRVNRIATVNNVKNFLEVYRSPHIRFEVYLHVHTEDLDTFIIEAINEHNGIKVMSQVFVDRWFSYDAKFSEIARLFQDNGLF